MRPIKIAASSPVVLDKESELYPLETEDQAWRYVKEKVSGKNFTTSVERSRKALALLVGKEVLQMNLAIPHQPPLCEITIEWGIPDPISGLRLLEISAKDQAGRIHNHTWTGENWTSPSSAPDPSVGCWPFDAREERLGGGWEAWIRPLVDAISLGRPWVLEVPLDRLARLNP